MAYDANRFRVGTVLFFHDKEKDPNTLYPGTWLRLPLYQLLAVQNAAPKNLALDGEPHYHKIKFGFLKNLDSLFLKENEKGGAFDYNTNDYKKMVKTTERMDERRGDCYLTTTCENEPMAETEGTTGGGDEMSIMPTRTSIHAWYRRE